MKKCDSCGKVYQESKDVFCPHCGAVAQKYCNHGSSFDSKRYDRGELYESNNPQYQNTVYQQGAEPHAQRKSTPYNNSGNQGSYGGGFPELNIPELTKKIPQAVEKLSKFRFIGIIIFACVFGVYALVNAVNYDGINGTDYWEDESLAYVEEDANEIYGVVDKATIEIVEADGKSKTFMLKIRGMGFEDLAPEYVRENIYSGVLAEEMLSENTFVEMLMCDFSEDVVSEESYNNAINDGYYFPGDKIKGGCKYQFTYDFDYGEIVHIASGVDFYLEDGRYINAQLPFSAFSVSEDGKITYYTSYSDYDTAWNTVFSECSNEQDINRDICIGFDAVELGEEE